MYDPTGFLAFWSPRGIVFSRSPGLGRTDYAGRMYGRFHIWPTHGADSGHNFLGIGCAPSVLCCAPGLRRTVSVPYRSAMLELRVSFISDEVELRVAALLKGLAVQLGLLDGFWVEGDLIAEEASSTGDAKRTLAPILVAAYAQPRATATALFADHGADLDASEVSRLLSSKEDWLLSMDRTFSIEIAFLTGMVGAGGEEVPCGPHVHIYLWALDLDGNRSSDLGACRLPAIVAQELPSWMGPCPLILTCMRCCPDSGFRPNPNPSFGHTRTRGQSKSEFRRNPSFLPLASPRVFRPTPRFVQIRVDRTSPPPQKT